MTVTARPPRARASAPHAVLLALLRGDDVAAAAAAVRDTGEWTAIAGAAGRHALAPLLHRALGEAAPVPVAAREAIRARAVAVTARSLLLVDELQAVLAALAGRGLRAVPLRGPALAERLHGDPTVRESGDLDLLVRRDDVDAVAAALAGRGFQAVDRRPGFARRFSYTLELARRRHGWVIVEPHWSLAYPPFAGALDMDAVWRRVQPGAVAGVPIAQLAAGDLLLHLALHLEHKGGAAAPLLWTWELDRLVRLEGATLDWDAAVAGARAAGGGAVVARALGRAVDLLATPVPPGVLAALHPPAAPRDRRLARLADSGVDGAESLALLFALPTLGARLQYAAALLFPSGPFMRLEYGARGRAGLAAAYCRRLATFSREGIRGLARLLG